MKYQEAKREILKLYSGFGWSSIFTRIRFFTAPYKSLVQHVPREGRIIDLGSGYGIFSNLLSLMYRNIQILAYEMDKKKAQYTLKGLPNVHLKVDDITKVDIPPVNCILLVHVLHHLNSYNEQVSLLKECYDKLQNNGVLLIVEIDRFPIWKFILAQITDRMLYPKDTIYYRFRTDLVDLLRKCRFKTRDLTFHAGTPFSHVLYICTK